MFEVLITVPSVFHLSCLHIDPLADIYLWHRSFHDFFVTFPWPFGLIICSRTVCFMHFFLLFVKKRSKRAEFAFCLFCFILFEERQMKRRELWGWGGVVAFIKLLQAIWIGGWQHISIHTLYTWVTPSNRVSKYAQCVISISYFTAQVKIEHLSICNVN